LRIAVVYTSTTGFTQKYAKWIAEDLDGDYLALKDMKIEDFYKYDFFVYGGSLHAVGIKGLKEFKERMETLENPKWIVFAVGATPVKDDVVPLLMSENLTKEEQKRIKLFYFRGGFDYDALKFKDKMMMLLLKLKIKMKPQKDRTPDEKGMINVYDQRTDFSQKKSIDRLVAYVRSL
jgi:menaquinone-dependent protoporphyrinogen IX oxidase